MLLLGATGTAGAAVAQALVARGHAVVCLVRAGRDARVAGVQQRVCDVTDPHALSRVAFDDGGYDAVVSCIASRTGVPEDAWAVEYQAQMNVLSAAQAAGVGHFVLLSAICVQKPMLAFQHAKLAFEEKLVASGLRYTIVRPTAFFKSLSGQIGRVRAGKPFLLFGDGNLTACKPISDADLGAYVADCISDAARWNSILPIGGPGPALTPRAQGEMLFDLLGRAPRFKHLPVALMDVIGGTLRTLGRVSPKLAQKGELARIGRYYATESMLVWDAEVARYDADATPETGRDTLRDFYAQVIAGQQDVARGEHAVF
jgi:divinyl chlorophyllide a 8-vinyl-reductase